MRCRILAGFGASRTAPEFNWLNYFFREDLLAGNRSLQGKDECLVPNTSPVRDSNSNPDMVPAWPV
jgi:hypothetical protein